MPLPSLFCVSFLSLFASFFHSTSDTRVPPFTRVIFLFTSFFHSLLPFASYFYFISSISSNYGVPSFTRTDSLFVSLSLFLSFLLFILTSILFRVFLPSLAYLLLPAPIFLVISLFLSLLASAVISALFRAFLPILAYLGGVQLGKISSGVYRHWETSGRRKVCINHDGRIRESRSRQWSVASSGSCSFVTPRAGGPPTILL